jgi:hypothetical protein
MATIDELIVQLDADLKPLESKLQRAEALSEKWAGGAAGDQLSGALSEGALEAGLETLAQVA